MRWNDWLIVLTIGALLGGAYFYGNLGDAITPRPPIVTSQGTYYVVANLHYLVIVVLVVALATAAYIFLLRRATRPIAVSGAIGVCVLAISLAMMVSPQDFLGRTALPRRYIDYPDAFARWQIVSAIGGSVAASSLIALLGLSIRAVLLRWRKT